MSVTVAGKVVRETDNAILFQVSDLDDEEVWFPTSQVESIHRDSTGRGTIVVTDWIAQKKGIT